MMLLSIALLLTSTTASSAFEVPTRQTSFLLKARKTITTPTAEDAVDLGIRDWPQQTKPRGLKWSETVADGDPTMVRYILNGMGSVQINDDEEESQSTVVGPGSMVEVEGQATLNWEAQSEMIILTPGYEETNLLLGVAGLMVVLCGALIATTS